MQRITRATIASLVAVMCVPTPALALSSAPATTSWLHLATSMLGLIVAIVLLVEALAMRRVALGGAIAEKMSYVILAIVCLAASALARWTGNFVVDVTLEQTQLASESLVIVAMALLTAYFFSVRAAMQSYLKVMTSAVSEPHPAEDASAVQDGTEDEAGSRG